MIRAPEMGKPFIITLDFGDEKICVPGRSEN